VSRLFGGPASNRYDAATSGAPHVRDYGAQDVERTVEIQVEHALKRGVIGFGDGLAAGESADQVSQNIELCKSGDNFVYSLLGVLRARKVCGKRDERSHIRARLLGVSGNADYGCAAIEEGPGDVSSETAIGPGY
jgi:hypothetical protein